MARTCLAKLDADAIGTIAYKRAFGHGLPEPIQVVAVRVTSRELLPQHEAPVVTATEASENEPVEAYSARLGTVTTFAVLDRDALAVDSGERIVIDPTGHMIVERLA